MQRDQVMIVCDVCGTSFAVSKENALRWRYELPMRRSLDVRPEVETVERCQVDLCDGCLKKAITMRCVEKTAERYTVDQGFVPERTGVKKYSFIEEE